jgi:GDP-D-mannose dehydratase
VSGQKQRTTFAKQQRERARMEKAAEKRKRREARKLGIDEEEEAPVAESTPLDPNDPYFLAKYFAREAE